MYHLWYYFLVDILVTFDSDQLSENFELLLTDAIHTHTVPVGEALLTTIDEAGTQQLFVPFCVEGITIH